MEWVLRKCKFKKLRPWWSARNQAGREVFWRKIEDALVFVFFHGLEEDTFLTAMLLTRSVIRHRVRD